MVQFIGTLNGANTLGDTLSAVNNLIGNVQKSQEKQRIQNMIAYVQSAKSPEEAKARLMEFQSGQTTARDNGGFLNNMFNPNAANSDFTPPELQLGMTDITRSQDPAYQLGLAKTGQDINLGGELLKNAQFKNSQPYQQAELTGLTNRNALTGAETGRIQQDTAFNQLTQSVRQKIMDAQARTAGATATVAENSANPTNLNLDTQLKQAEVDTKKAYIDNLLGQATKLGLENDPDIQSLKKLTLASSAYENIGRANYYDAGRNATNATLNNERNQTAQKTQLDNYNKSLEPIMMTAMAKARATTTLPTDNVGGAIFGRKQGLTADKLAQSYVTAAKDADYQNMTADQRDAFDNAWDVTMAGNQSAKGNKNQYQWDISNPTVTAFRNDTNLSKVSNYPNLNNSTSVNPTATNPTTNFDSFLNTLGVQFGNKAQAPTSPEPTIDNYLNSDKFKNFIGNANNPLAAANIPILTTPTAQVQPTVNPYGHYTKDHLQFNSKDMTPDVMKLDDLDNKGYVPDDIANKIKAAISKGATPAQIVASPEIQSLLQQYK